MRTEAATAAPTLRDLDAGPFEEDFGGQRRTAPARVVSVADAAEIAAALDFARGAGLSWRVRGAGHSCGGQTLTDGVVLATDAGAGRWRLLDDGCVEASGGAHWLEIERGLNALGRGVPVLPDYLSLSVGGTLSVGGYGVRSVRWGGQVDLVARLRVVTPGGDAVWCDRDERGELFRAALAGGGEHGVIERAVLRTAPLRRRTHWSIAPHVDLPSAARSLAWLWRDGAPEGLDAFQLVDLRGEAGELPLVTAWFGALHDEGAAPVEPHPEARALWHQDVIDHPLVSHARRAEIVAQCADGLRYWCDHVFPGEAFVRFLGALETMREDAAFSRGLMAIYALAIARPPGKLDFPGEAASGRTEPMQFGVGVYHVAPRGDAVAIEEAEAAQRAVARAADALGGRFYRYGWRAPR